jgi:hypothetical protein
MRPPTTPLVEVQIRWGETTLAVEHLGPGESFSLRAPSRGNPGFAVPEDLVTPGQEQLLVARGGRHVARVAGGMKLHLDAGDGRWLSCREAAAIGLVQAGEDGVHEVTIEPGRRLRVSVGGLEVYVHPFAREPRTSWATAALAVLAWAGLLPLGH